LLTLFYPNETFFIFIRLMSKHTKLAMKGEQFAMNKGLKKILSLLLACVIILGVAACKKTMPQEAAEPAPSPGGADAAIPGAAATGGPEDSEEIDGDLISVSFLASVNSAQNRTRARSF